MSTKKSNVLRVVIEASKDSFGAYAENVENIYAAGDTLKECKEDVANAIKLCIECDNKCPEWLKNGDYELEYTYDTQSILKYYAGVITAQGIARLSGINYKQVSHYMTGTAKPRKAQQEKIMQGFRELASELNEMFA